MIKWDIPEVSKKEKSSSIEYIVENSIEDRKSIMEYFQSLDFNAIFWGVKESVFLSIILSTLLFVLGYNFLLNHLDKVESISFISAPFFYAVFFFLVIYQEMENNIINWKLTLRISFFELMALRMIIIGAVSVILLFPVNLFIWLNFGDSISLTRLLAISYSGLFTYRLVSLTIGLKFKNNYLVPTLWIIFGLLANFFIPLQSFIKATPTIIFVIIGAGMSAGYFINLKRQFTKVSILKEGEVYVNN